MLIICLAERTSVERNNLKRLTYPFVIVLEIAFENIQNDNKNKQNQTN